jgi:hypothetical protein
MAKPPLRRLFVPTHDPEAAAARIRSLFRHHVQSSITPPIVVQAVAGGVLVDLDVRVYDNYRVDEAVAAVRAEFPHSADLPSSEAD